MKYEPLPLNISKMPEGISEKTLSIHHDKLYIGYVSKKNEIQEKLAALRANGDLSSANQTSSELRALKDGETFATNGVYLHEWYFDMLGGDGVASARAEDALGVALSARYGSVKKFLEYFGACGMAARGWVVLAYDLHERDLSVYTGDAHNHGGVWGCIPIIVLDVYEHAYFIDFGADRKSYINAFFKTLNWNAAVARYEAAIKH